MALFPFRNPTTSDTEYFGGIDNTKWIWSVCTLPSNISTFFHSHSCLNISRTERPISPFIILNRYFGHQIKWYLHSHTACANLLKLLNEYLLLISRVTRPNLKEVFSFCQLFYSLTYLLSIAWTTSVAEGLRYSFNRRTSLTE